MTKQLRCIQHHTRIQMWKTTFALQIEHFVCSPLSRRADMKIIRFQLVAAGVQPRLNNHNVRALICNWVCRNKLLVQSAMQLKLSLEQFINKRITRSILEEKQAVPVSLLLNCFCFYFCYIWTLCATPLCSTVSCYCKDKACSQLWWTATGWSSLQCLAPQRPHSHTFIHTSHPLRSSTEVWGCVNLWLCSINKGLKVLSLPLWLFFLHVYLSLILLFLKPLFSVSAGFRNTSTPTESSQTKKDF